MKTRLLTKYSKMSTEKLLTKAGKNYKSEKKKGRIREELERRLPKCDELEGNTRYSNLSTVKLLKRSTKVYDSEEKMGAIGLEVIKRFPDENELNEALFELLAC